MICVQNPKIRSSVSIFGTEFHHFSASRQHHNLIRNAWAVNKAGFLLLFGSLLGFASGHLLSKLHKTSLCSVSTSTKMIPGNNEAVKATSFKFDGCTQEKQSSLQCPIRCSTKWTVSPALSPGTCSGNLTTSMHQEDVHLLWQLILLI